MAGEVVPVIDASKLLRSPEVFNGEENHWKEWSFSFRNYLLGIDSHMVKLMEDIATKGEVVPMAGMTERAKLQARNLMALLSSYCKKQAQKILRNMSEPDNGFSAWMALSEAMMSSTPQQLSSLLRALMKFNFSGSGFKSRVLEWEIEGSLYDRLSEPGEELPDKIKVATLVENAPMKLRDHLQVNADRFQCYAEVRMSYLSTRKFSTQSTDR